MNDPGVDPADLLVRVRSVLLDALAALADHRGAVIVVGAQAVHLRTGGIAVALAETTKDADVAIDSRHLGRDPRVENAMRAAKFAPSAQPGSWVNPEGIPVDLLVPEKLAGQAPAKARGSRLPPHDNRSMRRTKGLEAAVIDHSEMPVRALDPADVRAITARVAGPTALLIAKCHKIYERIGAPVHRINDKDAHDAYRLFQATDTEILRDTIVELLDNDVSADITRQALPMLDELFAAGPDAYGSAMAGRAEEGVGEPEQVAVAVSYLAADLIEDLRREGLYVGVAAR
ncbi:hypothetical protein [Nocardia carnea]|uniref:hypothetical protein n=1 Tax=Nocardia carnea TaxID=37328 RepID=UPI0024545CA0|nr:hypothetical protein [Nocardia carnea]